MKPAVQCSEEEGLILPSSVMSENIGRIFHAELVLVEASEELGQGFEHWKENG